MGLWGSIKGAVSDIADEVGDTVGDVASAVADTAQAAASTVVDATDDYVFDSLDWATGGFVDIDYDGGTFGVNLGIEGIAGGGIAIGENGISAQGDIGLAGGSIALGPEGAAYSSYAGIDFGPLPYMEGHVKVSADGDVSVGGEIQGTIPTPVGLLTGEAKGQLDVTDEGWGASVEAEGTLYTSGGTTISGGVAAAHMETDDGSFTSVSAHGSVSMQGIGTAGGGVGYQRVEQDGQVLETFHAEGQADVLGVQAAAEADYVSIEAGGQSYSDWSGQAAVDGPGSLDFAYSSEDPAAGATTPGAPGAPGVAGASGAAGTAATGLPEADITGGAMATAAAHAAGGPEPMPRAGGDPIGEAAQEAPLVADGTDIPDPADLSVAALPAVEPDALTEPPADLAESFDASIAAADEVEASVDQLFEGME
jgi:hypothetical protein